MEITKAQRKKEERIKQQARQQRKRRNMRIIVWATSACLVALIVLLAVFWPKPGPIDLAYEKMPTIGQADAKVKIVEFGDYKCPVCAMFSQQIMPKIKSEYVDTGKVSFSYQNWTIITPEADSFTAAMAGQAIYHQSNEAFWKFYDAMYKNQNPNEREIWATSDYITELAKKEGLNIDIDKLKSDIENRTYADEVNKQNKLASNNGFTGTPTILINGEKLDDSTALNYDNLKAAIDKALSQTE